MIARRLAVIHKIHSGQHRGDIVWPNNLECCTLGRNFDRCAVVYSAVSNNDRLGLANGLSFVHDKAEPIATEFLNLGQQ